MTGQKELRRCDSDCGPCYGEVTLDYPGNNPVTRVLKSGKGRQKSGSERLEKGLTEDRGRTGRAKTKSSWRRQGYVFSPRACGKGQPCPLLDLPRRRSCVRLLTSRREGECVWFKLPNLGGICYSSNRKLTQQVPPGNTGRDIAGQQAHLKAATWAGHTGSQSSSPESPHPGPRASAGSGRRRAGALTPEARASPREGWQVPATGGRVKEASTAGARRDRMVASRPCGDCLRNRESL